MNHRHVYMCIIAHAKSEMKLGLRPKNQLDKKNFPNQYFEFHHILPRSLFPLWIKRESNIVALTAREHFFCHQLQGTPHTKDFKKKLSERMQGNKNTKGKNWFTNGINNVVCFEQDKPTRYWKGLTLKREMTDEKRDHYRQAALKRYQK